MRLAGCGSSARGTIAFDFAARAFERDAGAASSHQTVTRLIKSIADEFRRYKAGAEGALAQVSDSLLSEPGPGTGNSLAVICWHMAGNFQSRFADFLTTDGEKADRHREEEFAPRSVTRAELMTKWELGWSTVLLTIDALTDDDLFKTVTIREQPLSVHEALHRSLAHASSFRWPSKRLASQASPNAPSKSNSAAAP